MYQAVAIVINTLCGFFCLGIREFLDLMYNEYNFDQHLIGYQFLQVVARVAMHATLSSFKIGKILSPV